MRSLGFLLVASAVLLAPAGCKDRTLDSICEQMCTCSPCTQADVEACIKKGDDARTAAEKSKCGTEMSTFLACMDETLSCQQGAGAGTTACDDQEKALVKCSGSGNPFLSVCQQANIKSAMCTGSPPPPDTGGTCSGQSECQSKCVIATTCDVLTGITFDQTFQNCLSNCFSMPGPK